jgi:DNA-binding PadR family transcriptional regulator
MPGTENNNLPLTPAVFHILFALSTDELHGYAIMKRVDVDSKGRVNMGPGTLYGSIRRMLDAGLIKESGKRVDPLMDDERRIYYKISALGKKALQDELDRYKAIVNLAKKEQLLSRIFAHGA